jgi:hypothetical protein
MLTAAALAICACVAPPPDTTPSAVVIRGAWGGLVADSPTIQAARTDYDAGRAAGVEAARGSRVGVMPVVLGGAGGALVGMGAPFGALPHVAAGIMLVALAGDTGSTDPPAELASTARLHGPDHAAGFMDGYRQQARAERRKAAWIAAGVGVAATLFFAISIIASGYT